MEGKSLDVQLTDVTLRLGSAAFTGAVIGINRDLAQKPIGSERSGWYRWAPLQLPLQPPSVPEGCRVESIAGDGRRKLSAAT